MAWDDEYDPPEHWGLSEDRHYWLDEHLADDAYLQGLFTELFAEPISGRYERDYIEDELRSYLFSQYDIDFDDVFDWDGWRDWYEGAA